MHERDSRASAQSQLHLERAVRSLREQRVKPYNMRPAGLIAIGFSSDHSESLREGLTYRG
jgi:hypothetical protein